MPHIQLPEGLPGIRGPMAFRPETARPLSDLAQVLLHDAHSLSRGERELIATYVSFLNDCHYCQTSHGAIAAYHCQGDDELVRQVKQDFESAPVSEKLKALLAEAGYAIHAYDLRGHGRSPGERTLVKSFREHLDDLDRFLAVLQAEDPRPPFLFGHSMGGLIAALYVTTRRRPLAGVILSGPALGPVPWSARVLSPVTALAAKASPNFGMRQLDAATVSRDPEVVAAYAADPLVYHGKMPAGTLAAVGRAGIPGLGSSQLLLFLAGALILAGMATMRILRKR